MIPKKIHFTIPQNPTERQLETIKHAKQINPDFEVMIWQDPLAAANFQLGCYFDKPITGAGRADLVRLSVVEQHGGIYLDSDMACLKPLGSLSLYSDFCCASEDGVRLTNAFFAAPAQHPATRALIAELLKHEPDWKLPPNETTGPEFFSRLLKARSDVRILPRVLFYPYNWDERPGPAHPLTLASHTWAASWKEHPYRENVISQESGSGIKNAIRGLASPFVRRLENRLSKLVEQAAEKVVKRNSPPPSYPRTEVLVTQLSGGITIFVDGTDVSVTPDLLLRGSYEPIEEQFVEDHLHGGDWFVDVGANVGIFSLRAAARVGPFGRVWSFEPNKNLHSLLKRSLIANWFHERVKIEPCALGDQAGIATLKIPDEVLGGAHLSMGNVHSALNMSGSVGSTDTVEVRTLDESFDELAVIRMLKIDVEGHEAKVLRGGRRLFEKKQIDYVLIEVVNIGDQKAYDETLIELKRLLDIGYNSGYLDHAARFVAGKSLEDTLRQCRSRNLVLANPAIL